MCADQFNFNPQSPQWFGNTLLSNQSGKITLLEKRYIATSLKY